MRDEIICSLLRLIALASWGGENKANKEIAVDVGSDREMGLGCWGFKEGLVEIMDDGTEGEGGDGDGGGRESLAVGETRIAICTAIEEDQFRALGFGC